MTHYTLITYQYARYFCVSPNIIHIFDDGSVRYKGVTKVKIYGRQETKIGKENLKELLKIFEKKNFINMDDAGPIKAGISPLPIEAIRMRHGMKTITIGDDFRLIEELRHEIIRAIRGERWVYKEIETCYEK